MKDLKIRIKKDCEGLFYKSETDAKIFPFFGSRVQAGVCSSLVSELGHSENIEINEISVEQFFRRATKINDWHGENEKQNAKRFAALKQLLEENLTDLKVIRIGTILIDVFVVGIDGEGNLVGIRTKAVET